MSQIGPLNDVRVVDLSRVLAGPLCTMILGDLGADVIKVERPHTGDETRAWGPPFDARGESAYYLSVNRNKLGIALDLHLASDRALALELIASADVVVDNFLPATLAGLGFGVPELLAQHEQLVWCSIGGFADEPDRPGYDFVVQAECGWMAITGEPDGDPMKVGVALADVLAARDAATGILAALVARGGDHCTPALRRVSVTLSGSACAALVNVAQNALVSGSDAARWGNAHANLVPYQLFHAADRPMVIAVGNDAQWRSCVAALGLGVLEHDASLASNPGRIAARDRVVRAIAEVVQQRPAREWIVRLRAVGVPCGIVKTVLEAIENVEGASALNGMPSSVGGTVRRPPPQLDQHGSLIRQRGWSAFG